MIVEPAMMNCGVILPEPGYLQGLKDSCTPTVRTWPSTR